MATYRESIAFENMACRACDRSSTNVDVRHNMTASAIYNLPSGPRDTICVLMVIARAI